MTSPDGTVGARDRSDDLVEAFREAGLDALITIGGDGSMAIALELFRKGLRGGVIAVDRDGNLAMPYNTEGMVRGAASNELAPVVEVF